MPAGSTAKDRNAARVVKQPTTGQRSGTGMRAPALCRMGSQLAPHCTAMAPPAGSLH